MSSNYVKKISEMSFDTKCKYFNKKVFNLKWIYDLTSEMRFDKAYSEYQEYFECFPNNYYAKLGYVDLLLKMGKFDEIPEIFELVDVNFENLEDKSKNFYLLMKLRYLCSTNMWKEAYDLLKNNKYLVLDKEQTLINILLCKKLNIEIDDRYVLCKDRYIYDLAMHYNYVAVINHIIYGHTNNQNVNKDDSIFNENIDIFKLYDEVRNKLVNNIKICWDLTTDYYIFKYDNVGICNNSSTNYFTVVTFLGTDQIITMYPSSSYGFPNCLDITPEVVEGSKVKRLSALDKFNKRYGKNID